jgi:hypothetical protein
MFRRYSIQPTLCLVCFCVLSSSTFGQFDELIGRVPDSANAVAILNAEKIFKSAVALREGWEEDRESRFMAGMTSIPPKATHVVIASQLDIEFMQPIWEVALIQADVVPGPTRVASTFGGSVDKVANLPAVRLPDDSFMVRFSDQVIGGMAPGNRQQVTRWISQPNRGLSPYLKAALGFADRGTEVIMALDLTDTITAAEILEKLESKYSDLLADTNIDRTELADALASLQGVTLGITVREKMYGKIKIDFGQDVTIIAPVAKQLLLAVLQNRGAMIDEFSEWKVEVDGDQVTLGGNLTASGAMRVSSLIELPTPALHTQQAAGQNDPDAQSNQTPKDTAQATRQYFKSTQHLLEDLQGKKGTATNLNIYGVWFDRYATKVDKLPLLNVDPEMLDYGGYLAQQLRDASVAVKQKGMRSRVRTVNANANLGVDVPVQYGYGYRYGRYGGFAAGGYAQPVWNPGAILNNNLRQQQSQVTQIRTQEKVGMAANVMQIMEQIKTSTSTARRHFTQKYQLEF